MQPPNRFVASPSQNDALGQQKSRRNQTHQVSDRVGLLFNGSPGRRPKYLLISLPTNLLFCSQAYLHVRRTRDTRPSVKRSGNNSERIRHTPLLRDDVRLNLRLAESFAQRSMLPADFRPLVYAYMTPCKPWSARAFFCKAYRILIRAFL